MSVTAKLDLKAPLACKGRRILIVRQPRDSFERTPYVIHLLIDLWREWGFTVEVVDHLEAVGAEEVVIPHVDTTVTPRRYEAAFARCAVVVNRSVTDISKRKISENLVTRRTEYEGPVIVKTDSNFGGRPEWERLNDRGRLAQAALIVVRRLPWTLTGMIGRYKIFDHPRLVPHGAWRNRRLVVEKFLPERREGMYCLRQHTFFGRAEVNTLAFSHDPIVKSGTIVKREILPEAPAEIREMRKALGFDFGKFDYVLHNGRVVLFDTNRTPTYNPANRAGSVKALISCLANGIHDFLG
jgi:hypothetical protein